MKPCARWTPALVLLLAASATAQPNRPLRQVVDDEVRAAWQRHKIAPAPPTDDAAFVRRLYLDLVGVIPSGDDVRQFSAEKDPKKREKLIERLLADPRHAAHQADVWDLVLFGRNPPNADATRNRPAFKKWLTERFAKKEPHDSTVRALLVAEQNGSELFHVQFRNQPEEATVAVSRIFLGTQLQCARCHDHPFESWTQKDFYGMAGFFVRVVVQEGGGSGPMKRYQIAEKSSGDVLFTGAAKDQKPGLKGEPVKPRFLNGPALDEPALPVGFKEVDARSGKPLPKPPFSRKEKLAQWLTAAENPWFARATVNRVWAQLMGRGLVHPVDDLGGKNEPSHPALLEALTKQFVASKFDMTGLIRELVNSETYQLAGKGASTEALPRWFERARVRPLSAEELLASICAATGNSVDKTSGATRDYFVRYFGEPTNGQGEFQGSLLSHLFLNHGGDLKTLLARRPGTFADQLLTSKEPWEQRVDRLFLAVLSRLPSAAERQRLVTHLTSGPKTDALVEEALWALLNTAEFRFNH